MDRQFPPEIIQLIVKASLGPHDTSSDSSDETPTRYSTLKSYSTLNSIWNGISRRFLYKYVTVSGEEDARTFFEACGSNEGTKNLVRSLTVLDNPYSGERPETLRRLLQCAPRVRALVLRNSAVNIRDLAQLQNLRRLYLTAVKLDTRSFTQRKSHFPSLTHFDCFNCTLTSTSTAAIRQSFPQLRSFAYREGSSLPFKLRRTAPQLEAVLVRSAVACFALLPHTTSLLLLSLSSNVELHDALRRLETIPRFLHFDLTDYEATLTSLQELTGERKKGLKYEFLNTEDAESGWAESIQESMDDLEVLGVQFEVGDLSFLKVIERMDEIMAEDE